MLHGQGGDEAGLARLKAVAGTVSVPALSHLAHRRPRAGGTASALVGAAREAFGSVDAIVHAAGFADRRDFRQLPRAGSNARSRSWPPHFTN